MASTSATSIAKPDEPLYETTRTTKPNIQGCRQRLEGHLSCQQRLGQETQFLKSAMIEQSSPPVSASCNQLIAQIVGIVGALMFGFLTVLCLLDTKPIPLWVPTGFVVFALMSAYLFLYAGTVRTDERGITQISPIGTFFIGWHEIESLATGAGQLVIYGRDRRLALPGPDTWLGRDRAIVVTAILRFCDSKGIQPRERLGAIFAISRNTRVSGTSLQPP